MKRKNRHCLVLLLVLFVLQLPAFGTDAHSPAASAKPIQPYSAVVWTATTLHSPAGTPSTFVRRTVYTRDASGKVRREIYRPTQGLQHDTTSPLEHVVTGSTSAQALPTVQSTKETLAQDVDLGASQFSTLPTTGRLQTFQDASGQRTRTVETWFCPTLGLIVHMQSTNARGDTVVSDLSDLSLGTPVTPTAEAVPIPGPPIPLLNLYRGLFIQVAHMEQYRLADDPTRHVNMDEIEDHLRKKLGLSSSEWQVLVDKSVKVESYTRETSKKARAFADQDRAARKQNPLGANTLAAGRATLHKMQLDLNAQIQGDIDALKTAVGPDATTHIQTYLQGPLASSMTRVPVAQLKAQRAQKGQAR